MHEIEPDAARLGRPARGVVPWAARRGLLLSGLIGVAGCAQRATVSMPPPPWPTPEPTLVADRPADIGTAKPGTATTSHSNTAGVLSRREWAKGRPMTSRMDRMTTITSITVHHDGMDPFLETQPRAVAARIELIRQRHRARGWADIGYHFVVDRAGRVWEARPLRYQGAHVRDHNPGNIGVVALGNFDLQSPSSAQLEALRRQVAVLMQTYSVPISRVHTHQEWAPTACPGRGLQQFMDAVRSNGRLLAVGRSPLPVLSPSPAATGRTAIPVSVGK